MTATRKLLAIDLGAESGRGILGQFTGDRLQLQEVHRFTNGGVATLDTFHWDVLRLHTDILTSLRKASANFGGIDSVGVDTWGVDFALLGRDDTLLGNPRHYRDPHTENIFAPAFAIMPKAELYRQTGLQFLRFNTLFQLLALHRARSPVLELAQHLLFIPDYFHFLLTGIKCNEYTDASTSQMLDPTTRTWHTRLVEQFGLPTHILGEIVQPGHTIGTLRPSVAQATGLGAVPVIAPATHDTGSAIAAVPARGSDWAYISSGTWSLLGAELPAPLLSDAALQYTFTNEGGVNGTIRVLKNIMGLWLVQECRRCWEQAGVSYTYDHITQLAQAAPAFVSLVDPDHPSFMLPANMPAALGEFCQTTRQPVPTEPGALVRCALESLALKYRVVLERLEALTGRRFQTIHIVGGGGQNALLCQFTADACNRPVLAGPVEATAIGNVLVQALGLKLLGSLEDLREVVRRSFEVVTYTPHEPARWDEAYGRFQTLLV
jgi:rhamnulokinase